MPTLAEIEREYRTLSALVTYAGFAEGVRPEDETRLEQLAQWRVELTAPDFEAASLAR